MTCTHVVLRALGRADRDTVGEGDTVAVDFPLVAPDVVLQAGIEVAHGKWRRTVGTSPCWRCPVSCRPVSNRRA